MPLLAIRQIKITSCSEEEKNPQLPSSELIMESGSRSEEEMPLSHTVNSRLFFHFFSSFSLPRVAAL